MERKRGVERPIGMPQEFARHQDKVGLAHAYDLIRLLLAP